jgi:hypothetical protein
MSRAKSKTSKKSSADAQPPPSQSKYLDWIEKHSAVGAVALVLIGSLRIVATYQVFNHTIDEPAHIACGMEWLAKGAYTYETQHPPLSRVAAALGPFLAGMRPFGKPWLYNEGAAILYAGGHYDRNLALARLGVLPFFWLACGVVFLWARKDFGARVALLALLLFTLTPPVLAHAGLATTDMALTAFLGAAWLALARWVDGPTPARTLLLGLCAGLASLSKFSFFAFFPACVAVSLIFMFLAGHRPGMHKIARLALPLAGAGITATVMIWAGYRFSFTKFPAPELYAGIITVIEHNRQGHPSYLLGAFSNSGFWNYYPVVLAVKTPLAFLGLTLFGAYLAFRKRKETAYWLPLAFAVGILLVGLMSRINIGVRHILPIYIAFAVLAAAGASRMLESSAASPGPRRTVYGLIGWMVLSSLLSHPDYLAYFNEFVLSEPEKVLVDSDLDWGQDMKRVSKRLRELGAGRIAFSPFIVAHLEAAHGFPPIQPSDPATPSPGWNVVSPTMWKLLRLGLRGEYPGVETWPDHARPNERVGAILLYYFAPNAVPAAAQAPATPALPPR